MTFLLDSRGEAFTPPGFSKWFAKQCRDIGLHGLTAHGLRKAACRRLAEAGCSANEIAAIPGHASLNEIARYTRAADQARMARNAVNKTGRRLANPIAESGKPAEKSQ
jgi:integrase